MTWKALQKSPPYFIKFIKEAEDLFYVGVTDYQKYWIINSSRKSFLADLKESNEGLEFDDENELVDRGLDMLNDPESIKKVSILPDEHEKLLTISMVKVYECPLKLELGLPEASAEHFFKSVIQPLLQTVCDLRSSQHELRELLKKKDREIEEYKIEGRAPRRLITTVYDDATHMMKHTTYEENFGVPNVPELIEAAAYAGLQKDKMKPQPKSVNAATDKKQKNEVAKQQTKEENSPKTVTSSKEITKIEKSSQNTLIDEITSIIPTRLEETDIPEFVVQATVKECNSKDIVEESLEPTPRKRPKNRLKY